MDECQRTKKNAFALSDPEHEGPNAKVTVHDPELAELDEHLIEQRPLLGMGILLKNQVENQAADRLVDGQRHARQGRRTSRAQLSDAMVGPCEDVAIEDRAA